MRARAWLLVLVLCGGAGAQSVLDFDDWMQDVDDGSQDLQRQIARGDVESAQETARQLAQLYARMEQFFAQRRAAAPDAVRWSREGRDFATQAVADLEARRFGAARRNALAIAHGCRDCHYQYKPL